MNVSLGHLTGTLGGVDLSDTEDEETESATETLDDAETESGLVLAVDVGILHTQNVAEIVCVLKNES